MVNKWVESTATVTGNFKQDAFTCPMVSRFCCFSPNWRFVNCVLKGAQAAKQDKEEEGLLPSPPMGEVGLLTTTGFV